MKLAELLSRPSSWIACDDPEGVVISSRIRLARNLRGHSFPGWADEDENVAVWGMIEPILTGLPALPECVAIAMGDLTKIDRSVLFERHLISREHSEKTRGSGLLISINESVSIMVNEEDHLRIQVIAAGLELEKSWAKINTLDSEIEARVRYAFSPRLGYLTSCPSNVGTGLRASAMVHLSGLTLMEESAPVIKGCTKMGLAVRGLDGEGSDALGHIFQISNQVTLGRSEEDLVHELIEIMREVVNHEHNARIRLRQKRPEVLHNYVGRALGILRHAYILTSKESIEFLSALRLGVAMGLVQGITRTAVDECMLMTRPAHLQHTEGRKLKAGERDKFRANFVRTALAQARLEL